MDTETPTETGPLAEAMERLAKHDPEMPVFSLLGQDSLAPQVIRYWAKIAEANKVDPEKVAGARAIADQCEKYSPRKLPD